MLVFDPKKGIQWMGDNFKLQEVNESEFKARLLDGRCKKGFWVKHPGDDLVNFCQEEFGIVWNI